jgi:hypothetical protein
MEELRFEGLPRSRKNVLISKSVLLIVLILTTLKAARPQLLSSKVLPLPCMNLLSLMLVANQGTAVKMLELGSDKGF